MLSPRFGSACITIKVYAGKDSAGPSNDFMIHEDLVRTSSPFFEKAMSGDWVESNTRTISLYSMAHAAFGLFFNWLYTRVIWSAGDECDTAPGTEGVKEIKLLLTAYLLGEMIQCTDFKDTIIDTYIESTRKTGSGISPSWIKNIWKRTPASSEIREVFLDSIVNGSREYWDDYWEDCYTPEAMWQLLRILTDHESERRDGKANPAARPSPVDQTDPCHYHKHDKHGLSCYKERLYM